MARRQRLGIGLLLAALASPAFADSDGDFCATSTYLAYETRLLDSALHQLHVVALESPLGEKSRRSVELPTLQVHGLLCEDFEVFVLGWDALITVTVQPGKPLGLRSDKLAYGGYIPSRFEGRIPQRRLDASNLGSVAHDQTIPLITPEATFVLITRTEPTRRPCVFRVVSSLEEVDQEGLMRFSLPLYDGRMAIDCECGE